MSEKLVWDSAMGVGNEEMDNQHKDILSLLQQAVQRFDNFTTFNNEFRDSIDDIVDLIRKHFELEELILSKHDCPTLENHKEEHIEIIEKLVDTFYEAMLGKLDKVGLERTLSGLFNHIVEGDILNKEYLHV